MTVVYQAPSFQSDMQDAGDATLYGLLYILYLVYNYSLS